MTGYGGVDMDLCIKYNDHRQASNLASLQVFNYLTGMVNALEVWDLSFLVMHIVFYHYVSLLLQI